MKIKLLLLIPFYFIFSIPQLSFSQIQLGISDDINIDYSNPKEYEIGGITVSGVKYYDHNSIIALTGISVGDKIRIPGEKISDAIQKLWSQDLFDDISVSVSKIEGSIIFIDFYLVERPRLSRFSITGVRKVEADEIREDIKLNRGDVVTEHLIVNTKNLI